MYLPVLLRPAHLLRHPASSLSRRTYAQISNTGRKITLASIRALYQSSTPITVLTAYDYPTALHADHAGVDITLVGDSLAMVCLGHSTTQAVTLDQMIHHAKAARRGTQSALLVADLPFGTYESSTAKAVESAIRLVKEAAVDAVKIEGGVNRVETVRAIIDTGISVMGHVGLLPQSISLVGAFRAVGRTASEAKRIVLDARALEQAGAFSIIVECVPPQVAELITSSISIPTIGIGSGASCAGQVLVYHDLLRFLSQSRHQSFAPKFSKSYAELGTIIDDALRKYCEEVRRRDFPSPQFSPYNIPDQELEKFQEFVEDLKTSEGGPSQATERIPTPAHKPPLPLISEEFTKIY